MPGQAEHRLAADHRNDRGFTGFHRDSVHQHSRLAQGRYGLPRVVARSDRASARQHHHVAACKGPAQRGEQAVEVVSNDPGHLGPPACRTHGRAERERVHVAHLAGLRHVSYVYQLVSSRHNSYSGADGHVYLYDAHGGQRCDVVFAQRATARQQQCAAGHVFVMSHDVFTRGNGAQHGDGGTVHPLRVLHHDNGVGPLRDHRSCGDFDARVLCQYHVRSLAHGHLARDLDQCRQRLRRAEGVGSAQGIAVHRGACEPRQVGRTQHVMREASAYGVYKTDALNCARPLG
ncbi:MAG: hypothetical protein BWY85_01410 [Firmicutes bacterium ADurb.Bin506]|nr:MAG: hypothetical protein BWY85_01410 [Firmicutes bacterium ADurb.Bin506]